MTIHVTGAEIFLVQSAGGLTHQVTDTLLFELIKICD